MHKLYLTLKFPESMSDRTLIRAIVPSHAVVMGATAEGELQAGVHRLGLASRDCLG